MTLGLWVLTLVAVMMTRRSWIRECPTFTRLPDCGRPPTGQPVATNPRFTAADGSFSVSYPAPGAAYQVTTGAGRVTAEWDRRRRRHDSVAQPPAAGRDARTIAEALLEDAFPAPARPMSCPMPPSATNSATARSPTSARCPAGVRRNGFDHHHRRDQERPRTGRRAAGPFREFTPNFGPGPSPANLQVAQDMGKYVNSFAWRGDPPR